MNNPWINISVNDKFKMSDGDKVLLAKYLSRCQSDTSTNPNKDSLNLWPEPYLGNPEAPVYLLNGNPGYSNMDHLFTEDPDFVNLMQNNLRHSTQQPNNDFVYFNAIQTRGLVHGGYLWWNDRIEQLKNALAGRYPFVFDIEYSPFHSQNGQMPSQRSLEQTEAYQYTNELLAKAIKSGKIFIIMRKQNEWITRLEFIAKKNGLTLNYDKIMKLSSASNVSITPNNLKYWSVDSSHSKDPWADLVAFLR